MPEAPSSAVRLLTPSQVAEMLQLEVSDVLALVQEARLAGTTVGVPAQPRIFADSVQTYLDDQTENVRRSALWQESNAASFPELWGRGRVRHPD